MDGYLSSIWLRSQLQNVTSCVGHCQPKKTSFLRHIGVSQLHSIKNSTPLNHEQVIHGLFIMLSINLFPAAIEFNTMRSKYKSSLDTLVKPRRFEKGI